MALKEILSISGKPGLYRYAAKARSGIIVQSMADGTKMAIPVTANVSTLADISMYTDAGERPLHEIFTAMKEHDREIRALNLKKDKEPVKALFSKIVPDYQEHRVYVHDMQKAFRWYIILSDAGVTDFAPEGEGAENDKPESAQE